MTYLSIHVTYNATDKKISMTKHYITFTKSIENKGVLQKANISIVVRSLQSRKFLTHISNTQKVTSNYTPREPIETGWT